MRPWVKSLWGAVRYGADCVGLLLCWALWLVLGGLLVAQIGIALTREFAVPKFVLRSIEDRFTASNVNARFGRATFDPTGGVLIEDLSLSLPEFSEPVINAGAVFVTLDPWLLLAGKLDVRRVRATDITLSVPAMLAPSGRNEALLSELDFAVTPGSEALTIEHLTARIAGVAVDLQGGFHPIATRTAGPVSPLPLIANLASNYAYFCRQLIRAAEELAAFDGPQLHASLTPSPDHGALASATLTARGMKFPRLHEMEAEELRASIRIPLLGDAAADALLTFSADSLRARGEVAARGVKARVQGLLNPAHFFFVPQEIQITADDISARGFSIQSVASNVRLEEASLWSGELLASSAGSRLDLSGEADLAGKTAALNVQGFFAPALLDPIGVQLGRDVRRFVDFGEPVAIDLGVTFKAGWQFDRVAGHIAARQIDAYRVRIDSASGHIDFDGRHFRAQRAVAALGANRASGSFEQDLSSREFRFLLEGSLRPMEIRGWFGPWWPGFFEHFEFPVEPPNASVDVAGRWGAGYQTTVFVFAESTSPKIRGTSLDYGRTIMFIRPSFFDGLEFFGARGSGVARGSFVRRIDLDRREWRDMTFSLTSTLDLATGGGLLGPTLADKLTPFTFAEPPEVKASGQFDGPAAPGGEHQTMKIEARSSGAFSVYDFPARNLSFEATVRDEQLSVERVEADVASGHLAGRARIAGPADERKLEFDITLREAILAEAVTLVSDYTAHRRGDPESEGENVLSGKGQVKFDLSLAASGSFDDLLSYQGIGQAQLSGAELGEVKLLGLLSDLLDFTALRFTTARLDFQLLGPDVVFPAVSVTGENSAIEGHGDYSLENDLMDFNARVYPFQESKSIIQTMVGAVLTPLSTMLEVKLTGKLKQPRWAFVIGPTNFFRSLSQSGKVQTPIAPEDAPSTYLKR